MNSTQLTLLLTFHILTLAAAQSSCLPGSSFNGTECRLCSAGAYQDESGATTCKRCPTGTFNEVTGAQGIDVCLPCPAGTFSTRRGNPSQAECEPCPIGTSSVPGSRSCVRCEAGQFLFPRGNRVEWNRRVPVCRPCPTNEVAAVPNSQSCDACPFPLVRNPSSTDCVSCRRGFGYVLSTSGTVTCERCRSFRVSDGTTPCQTCPSGSANPRFATGSVCTPCPPGTTSDPSGKSCIPCAPSENLNAVGMPFCLPPDTPCPQNYFFNADNACQTCTKSERFDATSNSCVPCGRNRESGGGVDTRCRPCGPGREGGRDGCVCRPNMAMGPDGACFLCQLGRVWNGSTCEYCKEPFQFVTPGTLTCRECPAGTLPNSLRTGCNRCPDRTRPSANIGFFREGDAVCVDEQTGCPPAHSRVVSADGNLVACSPDSCPRKTREFVGRTRPTDALPFVGTLRECVTCETGSFISSRRCQRCPDNERSGGGTGRTCQRCPDGLMRADLKQLDRRSGDGRRCACLSGHQSRGIIDRQCALCPRGTFGFEDSGSGCRPCPLGLVSTRQGSTECSTCPSGMVADARQRGCEACPPGTISFGIGETECVVVGSLA